VELGYNTPLNLPDSTLDGTTLYEQNSTMRTMSAAATHVTYSELLRGPPSLGALYAANGIRSIPSDAAADRAPGSEPYWNAGYNTLRYGCRDGGPMCGVQVEMNFAGVLDTPNHRARFSEVTVVVLRSFLEENWGLRL